ncbi:porin [Hyphomicrobium methylovorum]|nr:porin [Hyphomicrobium methylovorum]
MALAAVFAVAATSFDAPARAADLGGNCCADLEERIAELEATTARKGNRKVSLTISGYIAQEITFWDDGRETNTYIHGLGPTQASHFKLNGQAVIAPGWTAGYMMRIQDLGGNAFGAGPGGAAINQNSSNYDAGLNVQMSFWYLQSKDLGKLSVGRLAHAAKSAAMGTDQSGTAIIDNYTFLAGFPQFYLRSGDNLTPPVTWGNLGFCYYQNLPFGGDCTGIVMNGVRYDLPAFGGFTAAVSWGEDDIWEVAARYAGVHNGFKLSLGVGYSHSSDAKVTGPRVLTQKDTSYFQAGAYVEHVATGLFLHGAYGYEDNNSKQLLLNGMQVSDGKHWYIKSGIRQKWNSLGATIIYGDYAEYLDQMGPAALARGATSSKLTRYGGGIAQEIDAAAMTTYLKYQRYEGDVTGAPSLTDLQDLSLFTVGALINF